VLREEGIAHFSEVTNTWPHLLMVCDEGLTWTWFSNV
jgi:hypothetical protein